LLPLIYLCSIILSPLICPIDLSSYHIHWVPLKDNTWNIIPTISCFGLDGNHLGVWSPQPINKIKTGTKLFKASSYSPNTKLLSPFNIKAKGLTNVKWRLPYLNCWIWTLIMLPLGTWWMHYTIHAPPRVHAESTQIIFKIITLLYNELPIINDSLHIWHDLKITYMTEYENYYIIDLYMTFTWNDIHHIYNKGQGSKQYCDSHHQLSYTIYDLHHKHLLSTSIIATSMSYIDIKSSSWSHQDQLAPFP